MMIYFNWYCSIDINFLNTNDDDDDDDDDYVNTFAIVYYLLL